MHVAAVSDSDGGAGRRVRNLCARRLGLGTHALAARVPSEQTPSSKGSCILLGTVRTIWGEGGGTLRPHTFVEGAHRRPRAPTPVRTSRTAVRYPVHPTLLGNTPAD